MEAGLQGRGPKTHAFTHALESNHHLFINLASGKVSSISKYHFCRGSLNT